MKIPSSADVEPDRTYYEKGMQLRALGVAVTYESGVYMILTCRPGFKPARFWRTVLGLGRTGLASAIRSYGGDYYWSEQQTLDAWTMAHGRKWNNGWSEIMGREVTGGLPSGAPVR